MSRNDHLQSFAARLRQLMAEASDAKAAFPFNDLALELFELQFDSNPPYRQFCHSRRPAGALSHWTAIPAVPTSAFKEYELSCIPVEERTAVFFSSGTTGQRTSRHFHNQDSLAVYEASLTRWFAAHFPLGAATRRIVSLTPDVNQAPHSSLVHMFDTLRRKSKDNLFTFAGEALPDGAWQVDVQRALQILRAAEADHHPVLLLGTAFSYVHLLDYLANAQRKIRLSCGSSILETGGYKGRARALPKAELHALITQWLGVPDSHIICEYGMSELSSQAYDGVAHGSAGWRPKDNMVGSATTVSGSHCPGGTSGREGEPSSVRRVSSAATLACGVQAADGTRRRDAGAPRVRGDAGAPREFQFPPWARVQIVSPETGEEVAEGETGLIRVFDLANVYSVLAVQTEDLAIRRGAGFELIGRATLAEPRGCSLMDSR